MEPLSSVILIVVIVALILISQIKNITQRIDEKESQTQEQTSIYANFSAIIQEKLRQIKADLKSDKENAKYKINEIYSKDRALEKISDFIRRLVFFETMNAKNKSSSQIESELFEILQELDKLIERSMQNGENLADELRDYLFNEFEKLKN